jgi:hypothetical protein
MSKDTISVKNCVFCSNADGEKIRIMEIGNSLAVVCMDCGAIGPIADAEDGAIGKWNTRTTAIISNEAYERLIEEANGEEKDS